MKYYTFTIEIVVDAESEEAATSVIERILSDHPGTADGSLADWGYADPFNPCVEEEA